MLSLRDFVPRRSSSAGGLDSCFRRNDDHRMDDHRMDDHRMGDHRKDDVSGRRRGAVTRE